MSDIKDAHTDFDDGLQSAIKKRRVVLMTRKGL
jgi:hypothetical protein